MTTYRDLVTAFRKLDIDPSRPIIVHASLSSLGEVVGGADTLLGALLSSYSTLVMPTFTYKTMVIPEVGPPDNALHYGSGKDSNRMAEFFHPAMPADRSIGVVPETLRRHTRAYRSSHPILSFAGINAKPLLDTQTLAEPLAPIRMLSEQQGWVLLVGVDHKVNTSIHYAESLAGRKSFTRWALTLNGVVECPGFPGCSDGFEAITPFVKDISRKIEIGTALVQAIPIPELVESVCQMILADPLALLCDRDYCERCDASRVAIKNHSEIRPNAD